VPDDRPESLSSPAAEAGQARPKSRPRWTVKTVVLRVLFWYVVIAAVLALFQRRLIYVPSRAERITVEDARLSPGVVHDILVPTEDGLTLHGWHFLPTGRTCRTDADCDAELQRGRLLVLFFHGNGGDRRGREFDSLIFAGEGADVFVIDYRCYGENPGSPSESGLAIDARALWKYATETRGVPPERIVLYGESLGGGVAIRLCADLCEAGTPPAGLIVRSTFTSLPDAAAHHFPWLPVRLLLFDRFASIERIGAITCPNLHIHGTDDQVVPFALGRRLFEAAPAQSSNGIPKQFVELDGADHNDVLLVAQQEFTGAVSEFFKAVREHRDRGDAKSARLHGARARGKMQTSPAGLALAVEGTVDVPVVPLSDALLDAAQSESVARPAGECATG
jgi:pimeloyl-ACP methyl ester carboxylesterase